MNEAHLRPVFLMLAGKSVAAVSPRSRICRTSFFINCGGEQRRMLFAVKLNIRQRE
jgi:hypothetical protein